MSHKEWRSIAVWDPCHGFQDNTTTDEHETREQAEAVCKMLEREGFGGKRCHFPISTRVEPTLERIIKAARELEEALGQKAYVVKTQNPERWIIVGEPLTGKKEWYDTAGVFHTLK